MLWGFTLVEKETQTFEKSGQNLSKLRRIEMLQGVLKLKEVLNVSSMGSSELRHNELKIRCILG